jgi:hypothetical protein
MINNDQLFQYLEKKIPGFVKTRKSKSGELLFTCPNIGNHKFKSGPSASFMMNTNKIWCQVCGWKGDMLDAIRVMENDKKNKSDAEITDYLISTLNLEMYKELETYEKYGWTLLPLSKNDKIPIPGSWEDNQSKDRVRWIKWLNNELNIAIRTGEISGCTVIDADIYKDVLPEYQTLKEEVIKLLEEVQTLAANSARGGKHFFFAYDKELRQLQGNCKANRKIDVLHIDIRNDGGYLLIEPSKFEFKNYKFVNLGTEIKPIPANLKAKLLELIEVDKSRSETTNLVDTSSKLVVEGEPLKLKNNNLDGCCNSTFVQLGGALIKQLSPEQTEFVLFLLNKNLLENPMPTSAIKAMLNSLDGYKKDDESTYENIIIEYMKQMQTDITAHDIMSNNPKLSRAIVDKYFSKFVKSGQAVRLGRGRYQYKEKITWLDTAPENIKEYQYKIPLFNDLMYFQTGDVLLLGAITNDGKTTIALNMLDEMIKQGVKPYYIYSEAGSRFQKTSKLLDISGKYFHTFHADPIAIELEYNAFTIIDWLHLENKAETDNVLKKLNDELQRKGGVLVIFTQLKTTREWFAPNLIDHYPTFAARLFQDNDSKTESHWQCDKIKEPRGNFTTYILPTQYNQDTHIFKKKNLI